MQTFVIQGNERLKGSIRVSGAKNQALKLFPATVLTDEPVIIENVPDIEDIRLMVAILEKLGAQVKKMDAHTYEVCCKTINSSELDPQLSAKIRASVLFIGPLLHRFGKVMLPHPGGDVIGKRPINFHLEGFETLGAKIKQTDQYYELTASKLQGAEYVFEFQSVTATENLVIAAVLAQGKTVIKNAACEPEITSLCEFLNQLGAHITGAGTPTIEIEGVDSVGGGTFRVIPDRIETGTFALMAAITKSEIDILDCDPTHLDVVWKIFQHIGVRVETAKDRVHVYPTEKIAAYHLKTHEYPGFPTDLQAPFTVLMTQAQGLSMVHETVFEGRLFYVDYLNRMGADIIMCDPHRVLVNGPTKLVGRFVESPDIRAGIAMIMAAMIADGPSEIANIYQIDRGYEHIEDRLHQLGVNIMRKED